MTTKDNEDSLRRSLVDIGHSLFARGFVSGAAGNISLRLEDGSFLMTPTGVSFRELAVDHLSVLGPDGRHLGGPKPTKEAHMHLACYAVRPATGAVVHLHSTHATAYSCLADLNPLDAVKAVTPYGLMRYGRVALAPYRPPGSAQLEHDMRSLIREHQAVLLSNHGLLTTGKDIQTAACNAEELEESCRLYFLLANHLVRALTPEQQEELVQRSN